MNEEPVKKSGLSLPSKILAASAVSVILGIGLCSMGGLRFEGPSSTAANLGILAFFGGLAGCFISIVWLVIAAIAGGGKK